MSEFSEIAPWDGAYGVPDSVLRIRTRAAVLALPVEIAPGRQGSRLYVMGMQPLDLAVSADRAAILVDSLNRRTAEGGFYNPDHVLTWRGGEDELFVTFMGGAPPCRLQGEDARAFIELTGGLPPPYALGGQQS